MLSAMQWALSKVISPFWRAVEEREETLCSQGQGEVRHLRGAAVTQLCLDYGMIDDAVYFTSEQVLGGVQVSAGDLVDCIAVRDRGQGGWTALRVEKSADAWDKEGSDLLEADGLQLRPLIGTITSLDANGGCINQTTYFPRCSLCKGYEPMKGDWVQAKYYINSTQWTTQAQSVAPLRYCRLDQVRVTSMFNNSGAVEESVFFSLDCLLLPANYRPSPGHVVNLVMVESMQSLYSWRALCMAPWDLSVNATDEGPPSPPPQNILDNKGGLEVSDYGQFGNLMLGEQRELVIWIQNNGSDRHRLKCCDFAGWDSTEQFSVTAKELTAQQQHPLREKRPRFPEQQGTGPDAVDREGTSVPQETLGSSGEEALMDILPGERFSVAVTCHAKNLGSSSELLLLHFSSFTIGRRLDVTVASEDERLLQPSKPYCPPDVLPQSSVVPSNVITVSAPKDAPKLSKRRLPNFLPKYPLPLALRDCVEAQSDILAIQPCLGEPLAPSNMHLRFSTLLWLEELHAEKEIKEFAIHCAFLQKAGGHLHLEVPGVSEGRPNLNIGDKVLLKAPQNNGVVIEYVSYVTEVRDETVSLRVNAEFLHSYSGEPLDVEFCYSRLTMRRCHNAVELTKDFGEILFPSRVTPQSPQWTGTWFNEPDTNNTVDDNQVVSKNSGEIVSASVAMRSKATQTKGGALPSKSVPSQGHFFNRDLNSPQREAVKRILAGEGRPSPYVLFGPPGTGKTITLIEAILQVYHFVPHSRLLVCTPSNSAADLICIRLHHSGLLDAASLARVNASSRQDASIPEELKLYSMAGEDIREASFHRIVVSTCSSAAMFHNIGLQVGHFTHVFLDEAGQATEPESLIPISFISERDGQVVLAGDPCQLGPVVKSKLAAAFGLGLSLLERLMSSPLYSRHQWGYNPMLVTKLLYNYRSHEALLELPSKLFYKGELLFRAPRAVVDSLCQWKNLPKKGFPLLFHGVRASEMREGNNPSWFNTAEAVQVMLYCCQLAKKPHKPVSVSDIGVISPYRQQCEKIRLLLAKTGLSDIKVGSVEEFQGQEFLVIIVSTVRSNESAGDSSQGPLGFLSNPKRFNVAVTRPKALLLMVGNPHVLVRDLCFRTLLQYCVISGAYVGCDPPPSLRDMAVVPEE